MMEQKLWKGKKDEFKQERRNSTEEPTIHIIACEQNEESIEIFENIRKISSFFNESVESKEIEKN